MARKRRGSSVVAHPHPAHGGNMAHPVVIRTAERAASAGLTSLRFDFAGVGQSEGDRKDFESHLRDWRVAVTDLRRRVPTGPLVGAGFSYGARSLAWLLHRDPDRAPQVEGVLLLALLLQAPLAVLQRYTRAHTLTVSTSHYTQ